MTFKIPVAAYATTLAALSGSGLGTQLSLTQQTQDVTQQVADVSSRVASDDAAIAQLRSLLSRAGSVGELLTVQNQIDSEESDLESMLVAAERAQPRDRVRDGHAHAHRPEGRGETEAEARAPARAGQRPRRRLARAAGDGQLAADDHRRGRAVRRGRRGGRRRRALGSPPARGARFPRGGQRGGADG